MKEQIKHLVAITIALLPSAVLAEQFTPEQMIDVMTKSPDNRDVRVHDAGLAGLPDALPGDDWESSLGRNGGIVAEMFVNH